MTTIEWLVCLLAAFGIGLSTGAWLLPEREFAACIEVPSKVQMLPRTKAEVAEFVRYYKGREI